MIPLCNLVFSFPANAYARHTCGWFSIVLALNNAYFLSQTKRETVILNLPAHGAQTVKLSTYTIVIDTTSSACSPSDQLMCPWDTRVDKNSLNSCIHFIHPLNHPLTVIICHQTFILFLNPFLYVWSYGLQVQFCYMHWLHSGDVRVAKHFLIGLSATSLKICNFDQLSIINYGPDDFSLVTLEVNAQKTIKMWFRFGGKFGLVDNPKIFSLLHNKTLAKVECNLVMSLWLFSPNWLHESLLFKCSLNQHSSVSVLSLTG